jgi:DNA-binding GntR family transcriptional regulator
MAGGMSTDLSQRTYRALWDLIATRTLRPGDKVTAEGLSQRFGVSRTTVKTALDQLALEGLVLVRPQVGTFVRGLSAQDVREIWAARLLLETGAAREGVTRATPAQRAAMRALVAEMAPLLQGHEHREGQYRAFVELDRRFHELLVQTADNRFLLGLHRQAAVHTHAVSFATLHARRGLRRTDEGLREHEAIVEAFERRDPRGAAAVLERHIERSRDVALQALVGPADVL